MPTVTIDSIGTAYGLSSYGNSNASPMEIGKNSAYGYTMHGRVKFPAIDKSWYIKSVNLKIRRADSWASRSLRFGTRADGSFANKDTLDWSQNYSIPSGYAVRTLDLTAHKAILQGYTDDWYLHITHGSGTTSFSYYDGQSSGNRPKLVIEYEEATLTVPGDEFTIESQKGITVGTSGSGLTHKVSYSIGSASGVVASGITAGATVNWTPPAALAEQIPSAMAGIVTLTLESYLSGVLTSTLYYNYTLRVPSSYVPTISSATFGLSNPSGDNIGIYVQGRSRTACTINATAPGGATIVEYRLTIGGKTYASATSPITSDVLTATGALNATLVVKDSRGLTATMQRTAAVTVHAYAPPVITALSVERALVDGTLSNDGTYLKFSLSCSFSSLNNLNTKAGSIKYRPVGGSFGAATSLTTHLNSTGDYVFTVNGTFGTGDIGSGGYVVSVSLTDKYNTSTDEGELSSRAIWIDRHGSGSGVAIGKVADVASLFDVGLDSRFDGVVSLGESGKLGNANLANNAAWRAGTSGWLLSANVARDEAVTLNGGCSLKCNQTGLSSPAWYGAGLADASRAACAAGDVFSASVYVLVQDSATFDSTLSLELQVFDASGTRVQTNSAVLTPASADDGKWLRMEVNGATITAADAATCNIRFYVRQNGVVWFACPKLEKGPLATEFVANVEGDVNFKGAVGFTNGSQARNALGIYDGAVAFSCPASGQVNVAIPYADYSGAAVTLPRVPRVQVFPVVTGGGGTADAGAHSIYAHAYNVGATTFSVRVFNESSWARNGTLNWIAYLS